jgi:hypothetical protein
VPSRKKLKGRDNPRVDGGVALHVLDWQSVAGDRLHTGRQRDLILPSISCCLICISREYSDNRKAISKVIDGTGSPARYQLHFSLTVGE